MNTFYQLIITDGTTTYTSTDLDGNGDFGIESGSLKLDKCLCKNSFELGAMNATTLEATIFSTTVSLDVAGMQITLVQKTVDDSHEVIFSETLFTGKVDSATHDVFNVDRQIVAYDAFYELRDKDITEFWNSTTQVSSETDPEALFDYDSTAETWISTQVTTILQRLCAHVGLSIVSLPTECGTFVYTRGEVNVTGITFGQAFSMLCEVQAVIPHIEGDGRVSFINVNSESSLEEDYSSAYENDNAVFENYTTVPIDAVALYSSSNDIVAIAIPEVEDVHNVYPIVGNIFFLDGTLQVSGQPSSDYNSVLRAIRDTITGITYTPAEIPIITGNVRTKLGTKFVITRQDYFGTTTTTHHIVFEESFSGDDFVDQTIFCRANGSTISQKVTASRDMFSFGERFSKFNQELTIISAEVGNKADATHSGQSFGWELVNDHFVIKQTVDGVTTDIFTANSGGIIVSGDGQFSGILLCESDEYSTVKNLKVESIVGDSASSQLSVGTITGSDITASSYLRISPSQSDPSEYLDTIWSRIAGTSIVTGTATVSAATSQVSLSSTFITYTASVRVADNGVAVTFNSAYNYVVTFSLNVTVPDNSQITMTETVTVVVEAGQSSGTATVKVRNVRGVQSIDSSTVTVSPSSREYTKTVSQARHQFVTYNDIVPYFDDITSLGTSTYQFTEIWSHNYNHTSDRRLKTDIESLTKYDRFFDSLQPVSFRMLSESKKRIGFVAQDVLTALHSAGLDETDFAGYVDNGTTLGLGYTEFIALNTYEIQQLKKELKYLRNRIDNDG